MPVVDMTGTKLAPKQLATAAEVMQAAMASAARLRDSRTLPPPVKTVPVAIVRRPSLLELVKWPDGIGDETPKDETVIAVSFPVVRPNVVFQHYPRISDIIAIVAGYYKISPLDIMSIRRTQNIVRPRQIAAYLSKVLTPRSLPEIGRRMGGRDHTTILHAVRKIEHLKTTDELVSDDVELLLMKIADHLAAKNLALNATAPDVTEVPFV